MDLLEKAGVAFREKRLQEIVDALPPTARVAFIEAPTVVHVCKVYGLPQLREFTTPKAAVPLPNTVHEPFQGIW